MKLFGNLEDFCQLCDTYVCFQRSVTLKQSLLLTKHRFRHTLPLNYLQHLIILIV